MKAVFLDKDGTLIANNPYNVDPRRIRLAEGAIWGLPRLIHAGYRLLVVSNQSGVARGYFTETDLVPVTRRLRQLAWEAGAEILDVYYCPHHPEGTVPGYSLECGCRKPKPGLIIRAAEAYGIDLRRSWMVGDILDDVEAGRQAGCRTVLIDNGNETEWVRTPQREPDVIVSNFAQAVESILAAEAIGMRETFTG